MKKPVKKMGGGKMVSPSPVGGGGAMTRPAMPGKRPEKPMEMGRGFPGGRPIAAPKPNAKAIENANPNARFKRPDVTTMPVSPPMKKPATGGPMQPARPGMPAMPRSMANVKPAMPMRRAKGGMAKGKKK